MFESLYNKVAGQRPWHRCFAVNIAKLPVFFKEHLGCLILNVFRADIKGTGML